MNTEAYLLTGCMEEDFLRIVHVVTYILFFLTMAFGAYGFAWAYTSLGIAIDIIVYWVWTL